MTQLLDLVKAEDLALEVPDGEGFDEQTAFRYEEAARFRKTNTWLKAANTPTKLMSVSIVIRVAVRVLGSFFKGSSRYNPAPAKSVLPLISPKSPARAAIATLLDYLQTDHHEVWVPLVSSTFGQTSASVLHRCQCGRCWASCT